MLDYLYDYAGMTLNDIADALNLPIVYADKLAKNEILFAALNWLHIRVVEFDPDVWPLGTAKLTWSDLPDWVHGLYLRACECEVKR